MNLSTACLLTSIDFSIVFQSWLFYNRRHTRGLSHCFVCTAAEAPSFLYEWRKETDRGCHHKFWKSHLLHALALTIPVAVSTINRPGKYSVDCQANCTEKALDLVSLRHFDQRSIDREVLSLSHCFSEAESTTEDSLMLKICLKLTRV